MRIWAEKRKLQLACCLFLLLMLAGCNPEGGTTYEIAYPSGYARNYQMDTKQFPIEGSTCQLQSEMADDYKKTFHYNLQILDESDQIIYEYPDLGSKIICGSLQEDDRLWGCAEHWASHHHKGYLEGWLTKSDLLLIDMQDGGILFQGEAEKDELYLTADGTRCYFYAPGSEASERFFGLVKVPAKNAEIHYRDSADWAEKHSVYTFDYITEPDIDTSGGVETRLRFSVFPDEIQAVWTSYESVGGGNWEYLEKKSYEISLDEDKN